MNGLDQRRDMFRRGELRDAMAQIEHVTRAASVLLQCLTDLRCDDGRVAE